MYKVFFSTPNFLWIFFKNFKENLDLLDYFLYYNLKIHIHEENICDNFESSIPVSVSAFCAKCETNSWALSPEIDQYCDDEDDNTVDFTDPGEYDNYEVKPKKQPSSEPTDPQVLRMKKLAGLDTPEEPKK